MAAPTPPFPFSAILGHDTLRLALLLTAVDPGIGGVLIRGEKGTAKTTAVRALAPLLPDGGQLVTLPIGATDDRVVGSLDVEAMLRQGQQGFKPGLLSAADGGILYVDEINLLKDHLVDVLLDTAATGQLHVERDGVSFTDEVRFVLVGTMNPEEGELRPQLLDRFGLAVDVAASREPQLRAQITRLRLDFDRDPAAVAARFAAADAEVAAQIEQARQLLPEVQVHDRDLLIIASVCAHFAVDGMRADVVMGRAAAALAALAGQTRVGPAHIRAAALLALPHRRRRDPFDDHGLDEAELDRALEEALREFGDLADDDPDPQAGDADPKASAPETGPDTDHAAAEDAPGAENAAAEDAPPADTQRAPANDSTAESPVQSPADAPRADSDLSQTAPSGEDPDGASAAATGTPPGLPQLISPQSLHAAHLTVSGLGSGDGGRSAPSRSRYGVTVATSADVTKPFHAPGTVLAAALRGARYSESGVGIEAADLRYADNLGAESTLVIFVVDTSGSMAARARLDAVTGAISSLLRDAYQRRDLVSVVAVRDQGAQVVVPPTRSTFRAQRCLEDLAIGGHSPLADGFREAAAVIRRVRRKDPTQRVLIVVLTDGRATGTPTALADALRVARQVALTVPAHRLVINCERPGRITLGLAEDIAQAFAAPCVSMEELTGGALAGVVTAALPAPRAVH